MTVDDSQFPISILVLIHDKISPTNLVKYIYMNKPLSILIEEDNELAELCCRVLTVNGFNIERVLTREEALTRLELETPDMVVIDLGHPIDKAVKDIVYRIRHDERLAKTKSVILADNKDIAAPFRKTADKILIKPVTEKKLQKIMG